MNTNANSSGLKAWLRLARVSALPSAISNILASYLLAHRSWTPGFDLAILIGSSCCLYLSGMILNDFFDANVDAEHRPERPIPSGQISRTTAATVGFGFMLLGVVLAAFLGWRPACVALLLAICIVLYDGVLKQSIFGPFLMGACRSLNVLLGASTFFLVNGPGLTVLGFPNAVVWTALSLGIFTAGVTLLARDEATVNENRASLITSGALILLGLVGWATVTYCPNHKLVAGKNLLAMFPLLIGLISLPILRRVVFAIGTGQPKKIQQAVITSLRSIIILDAALCFLVAPDQIIYALIVIGLLIPSMLFGRFISAT